MRQRPDVTSAVLTKRQHGAGVAAALQAKSYDQIPVSGQDGDPANLNNIALGWQHATSGRTAMSLGRRAVRLRCTCAGTAIADVDLTDIDTLDDSVQPDSLTPTDFTTPGPTVCRTPVTRMSSSRSSSPTPLTAENPNLPLDNGWYATKDDVA
jgi:ABC-type sugar transport system substrate-binding protein